MCWWQKTNIFEYFYWLFLGVGSQSQSLNSGFWWVLGQDQGTTPYQSSFGWWLKALEIWKKTMMKALWNHQRLPFAALGDGSSCPVNDYQLWGVFMVLFSNQNWLKVKHYRKHLHFIRKKLKLPGKKSPWINRLREKTDGHSKKKRTRDRQRNMWLKGPKQCWRWILLRPSPIL